MASSKVATAAAKPMHDRTNVTNSTIKFLQEVHFYLLNFTYMMPIVKELN